MMPFRDFPPDQQHALDAFAHQQEQWQQHILDALDHMRRQLITRYLFVVIGLIAAGLVAGYAIHQNYTNVRELKKDQAALCHLRDDLQRRATEAQQFLDAHPAGAFGISAQSVQTQINGELSTLAALHPLICPPSK